MTTTMTPLRQRMIEDMNARKLVTGTQKGHLRSCERFAALLGEWWPKMGGPRSRQDTQMTGTGYSARPGHFTLTASLPQAPDLSLRMSGIDPSTSGLPLGAG